MARRPLQLLKQRDGEGGRTGRDYTVPSVAAATRILRWLADRRATLSEVQRALGLSKTTTYAILKTLHQTGFLGYDRASRQYFLGVELLRLGEAAARHLDDVATARGFLQGLVEETKLAGIIAQRMQDRLVVVHTEEGRGEIRATVTLGQVISPGVGSMGKAFAAFAQPAFRTVAARQESPKFTAAIEEIRRRGYSTSYEEYRLGVNAVAAPVFDQSGELVLVLCLIGFARSLPPPRVEAGGERLKGRCAELSRVLGIGPPAAAARR